MTLKKALLLNATLSIATGAMLTVAPRTVGGWLDVSIDLWLRLLGLALLGHSLLLWWATKQQPMTPWAQLNVAVIGPYPAIMIAVAATGLVDSAVGRSLLLLDGALVGSLAVAQWSALRARTSGPHAVSA